MSDETKIPAVAVAGVAGSKPVTPVAAPAVVTGTQSSASGGQPPVASPQSAALFGGHRGGGKRRTDGLVAGSEAAKAADREKDRIRKQNERAAKGLATLPPPLPGVKAPVANAPVAVAAVESAVPGAVAGAAIGAPVGVVPTFVAWTAKMLERPVKLFTKIVDRFRTSRLMERVRKLGLGKEVEDEAEKRMRYKDEQVSDFNAALTNCAVIELNKRQIAGAQHSHWLELVMTGGELMNCHMDTVDWLEKQILQKAEAEKAAVDAKPNSTKLNSAT